jgi:hypothetical protein
MWCAGPGPLQYEHANRVMGGLDEAVHCIGQLVDAWWASSRPGAVPLAVLLHISGELRTFGREFTHKRLRVPEKLSIAQLQRLCTRWVASA